VDDSLIIWFNGGPGCTSFSAGLFFEMGPVTIPLHPAGTLTGPDEVHAAMGPNPFGWYQASAILYVEQPVNVGFSRGPHEPRNETDIGRALDGFLQQFVHVFEAYRHKRIFLVGESYAGMYVPSSKCIRIQKRPICLLFYSLAHCLSRSRIRVLLQLRTTFINKTKRDVRKMSTI
jgi:carboxypeptidase C (cathepsin A)